MKRGYNLFGPKEVEILDLLQNIGTEVFSGLNMDKIIAAMETIYFLIIILFALMLPEGEEIKRKMDKVIKYLALLLAILSIALFIIKTTLLSKFFYLTALILMAAFFAIEKKYPEFFKAQK